MILLQVSKSKKIFFLGGGGGGGVEGSGARVSEFFFLQ